MHQVRARIPLANRRMGNYRPVLHPKQVGCGRGWILFLDEAECRLWGEVGCRLWRLALRGSRLAVRRGFYSYDPELGGSAWIELQK
jgi:hypothetical protein